jgi:hypothetical protein
MLLSVSGVKGWEVKRQFLMGDERSVNETPSHTSKLEAEKAASGPPVRLQEIRATAYMGTQLAVIKHCRTRWPMCWQCEDVGHLRIGCQQRCDNVANRDLGKG